MNWIGEEMKANACSVVYGQNLEEKPAGKMLV